MGRCAHAIRRGLEDGTEAGTFNNMFMCGMLEKGTTTFNFCKENMEKEGGLGDIYKPDCGIMRADGIPFAAVTSYCNKATVLESPGRMAG